VKHLAILILLVRHNYFKPKKRILFLVFLTLFGEKLTGSDPEDVIRNAFLALDEERTGKISEERLRELLMSMGDRYTDEEVDELFKDAPIKSGLFDYQEFVKIIKYGRKYLFILNII